MHENTCWTYEPLLLKKKLTDDGTLAPKRVGAGMECVCDVIRRDCKTAKSDSCLSVCPSVRTELGSHWTDFHEI